MPFYISAGKQKNQLSGFRKGERPRQLFPVSAEQLSRSCAWDCHRIEHVALASEPADLRLRYETACLWSATASALPMIFNFSRISTEHFNPNWASRLLASWPGRVPQGSISGPRMIYSGVRMACQTVKLWLSMQTTPAFMFQMTIKILMDYLLLVN